MNDDKPGYIVIGQRWLYKNKCIIEATRGHSCRLYGVIVQVLDTEYCQMHSTEEIFWVSNIFLHTNVTYLPGQDSP